MSPLGRKAIGTVAYLGGLPAVLESFTWAWGQMVQYNQELFCEGTDYIHYDRAMISDHGPARNSLVSRFLGDWLIQMDTDHQFDPDIVARLVRLAEKHHVDVISAVYQMKAPPHVPVLFQWVGEESLQPMWWTDNGASLVEIGSSGGGCLFVRRSVFDRLAVDRPFEKIGVLSEDHSFFKRCKEKDIKCYAALKVHSHHLRVVPVTMADAVHVGLMQSEGRYVEGFA